MRVCIGTDQFIELDLHGLAVSVLAALDKKYHQERDDRRERIDRELPCLIVIEDRTAHGPRHDHEYREYKSGWVSRITRNKPRKSSERMLRADRPECQSCVAAHTRSIPSSDPRGTYVRYGCERAHG